MLKVVKLEQSTIEPTLELALAELRAGQVIVVPTDTVYGLVCAAFNQQALGLLFKIKRRTKFKIIGMFVDSVQTAHELVELNEQQDLLLRAFWPGAVTFVAKAKKHFSELLIKDGKIGLRCPEHGFVLRLAREFGQPLAQSSVNLAGQPEAHTAQEALAVFVDQADMPSLIIDDGDLGKKSASLVLDITTLPPKIIRS